MLYFGAELLVNACVDRMQQSYQRMFGGLKQDYAEIMVWSARMALENISNGDALYHDAEHTAVVTLVGQEILAGKHMSSGGVTPEDWLHVSISLLCHDIGYVKGICRNDDKSLSRYETGDGSFVTLPPGASDAALQPYHVARGRQFVRERFAQHAIIDADAIAVNIEHTQFPVPVTSPAKATSGYADLVRAADLIGQLGDPRYLQKLHALFHEFDEIGANRTMGFSDTSDLRRNYPSFYWNSVFPYIADALPFLEISQDGRQILANLFSNVFRQEHAEQLGLDQGA